MKNVCVYTQQSMSHIVINTDVILTVNLNDLMGIGGGGEGLCFCVLGKTLFGKKTGLVIKNT